MNVVITTKQFFKLNAEFIDKMANQDLNDEECINFKQKLYKEKFFQSMWAGSMHYGFIDSETISVSRNHQMRPQNLTELKKIISDFVKERKTVDQLIYIEIADDDYDL